MTTEKRIEIAMHILRAGDMHGNVARHACIISEFLLEGILTERAWMATASMEYALSEIEKGVPSSHAVSHDGFVEALRSIRAHVEEERKRILER